MAKKALGQHFLLDAHAVRRIVESVPPTASVLEIGPGPGALTQPLLERSVKLTLIEKDDGFANHWQQLAESDPQLSVVHGDVLELIEQTVAKFKPKWIVGNLPYNISGPLTARLAALPDIDGMVLMYQREVGERITADPGCRQYGGLSVLLRHHFHAKRLLTLPPGAFAPPPKVHSTVVILSAHGRTPPCGFSELQRAVRQGFAHKRKTIANNFRGDLSNDDWQQLGIDPRARPETLDYDAWAGITLKLRQAP
ncbi:MAG: 16S rRNA (adenine(1518)-N(6)/adenine(1519)-N(6))-dimethyltransferase RsmA [Mariprofundaceae bacterium]